MIKKLEMTTGLWTKLIAELCSRGDGIRESGAFLLAAINKKIVTDFICYDDCDPDCLKGRYIEFSGEGYSMLWEHCRVHDLHVVADVHTHPRSWTGQSETDKAHPMILFPGHVALIVPHYAQYNADSITGVGAFEYQGDKKWKSFSLHQIEISHDDHRR